MIKKIFNKDQLKYVGGILNEVSCHILELIKVIDNHYGQKRNVDSDLGGYILILENVNDVRTIKHDILKNIKAEYTDIIKCKEGVNWTSSLFLLSSDYAIIVVCSEEISKILLENSKS